MGVVETVAQPETLSLRPRLAEFWQEEEDLGQDRDADHRRHLARASPFRRQEQGRRLGALEAQDPQLPVGALEPRQGLVEGNGHHVARVVD
eukprot:8945212-Pyramimonas_sp.AAC.1